MNDNELLYDIDPIKLLNMSPEEKARLIAIRRQNLGVIDKMRTDRAGDFDDADLDPSQQATQDELARQLAKEKMRKEAAREGHLFGPKGKESGVWRNFIQKLGL